MPQSAPTSSVRGTGRDARLLSRRAVGVPGSGRRGPARLLATSLVICLLALFAPIGAFAVPQPGDFDAADGALRLESIGPVALSPGGTLTAEITITNTSDQTLLVPLLEVRTRTPRVTDRDDLTAWQDDTSIDARGSPVGLSSTAADLAPGDSARVTVSIAADALGYSTSADLWGVRRLSFTLVSEQTALTTLRTFTIWRPDGATGTIDQSVLVPVASDDPAAQVTDPETFTADATTGDLARAQAIALVDGVDWLLDPSLLDPPAQTPAEDSGEGDEESPSPSESASAEDGEEPVDGPATPLEPLASATAVRAALMAAAGSRTVLGTPYAGADLVSLDEQGAQQLTREATGGAESAFGDAGVTSAGTADVLGVAEATGDEMEAAVDAGADVLVAPPSAVAGAEDPAITRSSLALLDVDGATTPVITPDARLSAQMDLLTDDDADAADSALTQQRILAETAAVAAQDVTAQRHLVMMPKDVSSLDADAVAQMMQNLEQAPWVDLSGTDALLDAAGSGTTTTEPLDDEGALLVPATITPGEVASPQGATAQRLDADAVADLDDASRRLEQLAVAMADTSSIEVTRLMILAATSADLRGEGEGTQALAADAVARVDELTSAISVTPASEYTLVADAAGVPITVSNDLATPVTVQVSVTSDTHVVRIGEVEPLTVPAHGTAQVTVPVEAIANGTVTLTTTLTTTEGTELTQPVKTPLSVNPAWENWTTMALVVGMGVLVVVGVLRARRTGSAARAPGVKVPEDPAVLASTGRSQPAHGTMGGAPAGDGAQEHAGTAPDAPAPEDAPQRTTAPPETPPHASDLTTDPDPTTAPQTEEEDR